MQLLAMSLTCALLAPAGPQKARILSIIHKDIRSPKLVHFDLLDKFFMGKIIKRPDANEFEQSLAAH